MDAQIEPIDALTRKITLAVPATRVDQRLERAVDQLRKEVKLPGFRQGHVPRRVIEQQFGRDLRAQLGQELAQEAVDMVVRAHALRPAAAPTLEVGKLLRGKPLSVTATVVLRPTIEIADYGEPPALPEGTEVTDSELDEQLESMRQQARKLQPVETPRPMTADDLAEVSAVLRSEGYPDHQEPGVLVGAGTDPASAYLLELALGLSPGESRTGKVRVPDDYSNKIWAGAQCDATVTLVKVLEAQLPPLDDTFAQLLGSETLEELRQAMRDSILRARLERAEGRRQRQIIEQIIALNPFEVPAIMVRERAAEIVKALGTELIGTGLGSSAPTLDDLEDDKLQDVLAEAEFSVRRQLVLEAVARREKMVVDDADRLARYGVIAERTGRSVEMVRSVIEAGDAHAIDESVLDEKAIAFLLERSVPAT